MDLVVHEVPGLLSPSPQSLGECLQAQKEREVEEILESMVGVVEAKPAALGNALGSCMETMAQLCRNESWENGVRRLAYEFVISAIEGFPSQPLPAMVEEALELSMAMMLEVEDDEACAQALSNFPWFRFNAGLALSELSRFAEW